MLWSPWLSAEQGHGDTVACAEYMEGEGHLCELHGGGKVPRVTLLPPLPSVISEARPGYPQVEACVHGASSPLWCPGVWTPDCS
jgi:hypothetical protein